MLNMFYVPIGFWIVIGGSILHEGINRPKGFDEPLKKIFVSQPRLFSQMNNLIGSHKILVCEN